MKLNLEQLQASDVAGIVVGLEMAARVSGEPEHYNELTERVIESVQVRLPMPISVWHDGRTGDQDILRRSLVLPAIDAAFTNLFFGGTFDFADDSTYSYNGKALRVFRESIYRAVEAIRD